MATDFQSGRRASPSSPGFTLPSLVLGLVVGTAILLSLGLLAGALFQSQESFTLSYVGNDYDVAPSYPQFNHALALHFAFGNACDQADAVYVYGGARSHPVLDPVGPSDVLPLNYQVGSALTWDGSGTLHLQSAWESKSVYSDLGAQFVKAGSTADFTVLTVRDTGQVTSITQQRSYTTVIKNLSYTLYEVIYLPYDWGSGSPIAGAPLSYRVGYRAYEVGWTVPPGAQHHWYRTDPDWARLQEGPAHLTFADPMVLAGDVADSAVKPGSRFEYFLAVAK